MQLKSYYELMNEITPLRLYHGLLAHGLFTEKLPPIFSSVNFFDYCQLFSQNFNKIQPTTYIFYENMREINIPRQLGIPSPFAYHNLCKCLSDNWQYICEHFKKYTINQTYKISRIHIREQKNTPTLFRMNYKNWEIDGFPEPDIMFGKRYLVKADISRFFPSIYSHSIPWALIGKSTAKKSTSSKLWYNYIDQCTRNLKYGETQGLIIGPHASNLLAEIISIVIDYNLLNKNWKYMIRNIDDYHCYVDSYNDGQKFIADLSDELRKFNLTINYEKTKIVELPLASTKDWVRQLKIQRKLITNMDYHGVTAFLDNVIDIMNNNKNISSIINYAIKILSKVKMTENVNEYYTKTILHYSIIYPYLIPLLEKYLFNKHTVDHSILVKFINKIYNDGIYYKFIDEVSFSLYFSIKYNVIIDTIDINDILNINNCIVSLLAFLYYKKHKNNLECKKLKDYAYNLSINNDDFGQNWLFIYELLSENELTGIWRDMKNKEITFLV